MRFVRVLAATLAMLTASPAVAQAPPHWGSDQIRAARPTTAVEAVVFDVRVQTMRAGRPPEVTEGVVTLAPSFAHLDADGTDRLSDYELCRDLSWTGTVLTSHSCYAGPAFRLLEMSNRLAINQVIGRAQVSTGGKGGEAYDINPYWDETELGVAAAERLALRRAGSTREFRLGEQVVTRVSGAAGDLTPEEMRRFSRWLAHTALLHPQVRREITAGGAAPANIESDIRSGRHHRGQTIAISNLRRSLAPYPLPPGLTSDLRTAASDSPRDRAMGATLAALDGRPLRPKPTVGDLAAALSASSAAGRHMEANFAFLNLTQQYPRELSDPALMARISPALRATMRDPAVARFMAVNNLAGDSRQAGDREAAATYLAGAREMDAMAFGTFRMLTYANLVRGSKNADKWNAPARAGMPARVEDLYWIHIAAYPWASNAFKDVGDAYLQDFDAPTAWLAYDLGRAVDPAWRHGVMIHVEGLESNVRKGAPDFF